MGFILTRHSGALGKYVILEEAAKATGTLEERAVTDGLVSCPRFKASLSAEGECINTYQKITDGSFREYHVRRCGCCTAVRPQSDGKIASVQCGYDGSR